MKISSSTKVYALYILAFNVTTEAFQHAPLHAFPRLKIVAHAPALMSTSSNSSTSVRGTEGNAESDKTESKKKKRADVMAFLRKKGAVGKNKDFSTAMGVDEGPVGKNKSQVRGVQKAKSAYQWCTDSGIIDDMTESFPLTSSGSEWSGFTDQVMGGVSIGKLLRETIEGRTCNVMKGKVSTYNNGGFIQMATDLSKDQAESMTVDASGFDGIELDVFYEGIEERENFNVHLRNSACERQFSSYRGTFEVTPNTWQTVRLPFSDFVGHGPGASETPFDYSALRRMGIVAIGKPMEVYLGVGKVGFFRYK